MYEEFTRLQAELAKNNKQRTKDCHQMESNERALFG